MANHATVRSGGLPDSFDHSCKQEWQHRHKELRNIQFTITRRSRMSAQNIACASQNTQGTDQAELQQGRPNGTSTHALSSSMQRTHHEQIRIPQQWMRKLLQQHGTENNTHHFASLVRQCNAWCRQSKSFQTRAKVFYRDLAWQGYKHRRIHHWDLQLSEQGQSAGR